MSLENFVRGPLSGVRVVEMAGLGPAPFAAMMLSDLGAQVTRVDRLGDLASSEEEIERQRRDPFSRGKASICIDVKSATGHAVVLRLLRRADVFIEGYRPGVMERLGLGPQFVMGEVPSLVYARMTGWGQNGPLSQRSGHDINYISIAGVLGAIGPDGGAPEVPLNLVGDFGGGAMMVVAGILAALLRARSDGQGDVIDASMVEGASYLSTMIFGFMAQGIWRDRRGSNTLDGGAPFYRTYRCQDGGYVSVGALEPKFFGELISILGVLGHPAVASQYDTKGWPQMRELFAEIFLSQPRAVWEQRFEGSDACVSPVLNWAEATNHPHNRARESFVETEVGPIPRPAPRFGRYGDSPMSPCSVVGSHTQAVLESLGYSQGEIAALAADRVVGSLQRDDVLPWDVTH